MRVPWSPLESTPVLETSGDGITNPGTLVDAVQFPPGSSALVVPRSLEPDPLQTPGEFICPVRAVVGVLGQTG